MLPTSSSSAEQDHHAFLYWPASGLVLAPINSYGTSASSVEDGAKPVTRPFVGAVAFKVGDRSVNEAARITHPGSTPIERSVVVGDRLLTLSRVGLAVNDLPHRRRLPRLPLMAAGPCDLPADRPAPVHRS